MMMMIEKNFFKSSLDEIPFPKPILGFFEELTKANTEV